MAHLQFSLNFQNDDCVHPFINKYFVHIIIVQSIPWLIVKDFLMQIFQWRWIGYLNYYDNCKILCHLNNFLSNSCISIGFNMAESNMPGCKCRMNLRPWGLEMSTSQICAALPVGKNIHMFEECHNSTEFWRQLLFLQFTQLIFHFGVVKKFIFVSCLWKWAISGDVGCWSSTSFDG